MRSSTFILGLLPCYAASAALPTSVEPLVLTGATSLSSSSFLSSIERLPSPSVESAATSPVDVSENEEERPSHLIAVPCQDCTLDQGDAVILYNFQALSDPENLCSEAKFRLSDKVVTVPATSDEDDLSTVTYIHDQWAILVNAICTSVDGRQRQTVTLTLDSFYGQPPLKEKAGFHVVVDPSGPGSVSDITIFKDISGPPNRQQSTADYRQNEVITRVEYVLTDAQSPYAAAESLLSAVKSVQAQLQQQTPLIQQYQESCRSTIRHRLLCSGQAICQRACEAFHTFIDSIKTFIGADTIEHISEDFAHVMAKMQGYAGCEQTEKGFVAAAQEANITMEKPINATLIALEPEHSDNTLVRVLEIIAGAIGLTALLALIRRRCSSLRRRVERLADREERRTAREYRRAARREAMRKRWRSVRNVLTCGFSANNEDEEKRALMRGVTEDGLAEEGLANGYREVDFDLMRADMNGLHYAHEIVVAMVRARDGINPSTTSLATDVRSRASTLPSYDCEKLPDYSSQPESDAGSVANGFPGYAPSFGASSAPTDATPESSIPELSPRPSEESLRTGNISD